MNEYAHLVEGNPSAKTAIVVLPDIWGLTEYSLETAKQFASDFSRPCYILDYFYQLTSKPSKFDPATDAPIATSLMKEMTGQDFISIFEKLISEIKDQQVELESIQVIGFCFGGRLAYLSGIYENVDKIVSFYGAGSLDDEFNSGQSAVATLCNKRQGDTDLNVLAFFGTQDESILPDERKAIAGAFKNANIDFVSREYPAGHAYFQKGRPSYDDLSAKKSQIDLANFIKK